MLFISNLHIFASVLQMARLEALIDCAFSTSGRRENSRNSKLRERLRGVLRAEARGNSSYLEALRHFVRE